MARRRKIFGRKIKKEWLAKGALAAVAAVLVLAVYFCYDLPDISDIKPLQMKPSIILLADDGTLIARYGGISGEVIPSQKLPRHLIAAVISVEDRRFYSHMGIDPLGLLRAMWNNVKARRWVQGGSTITQQLAKNLFLTADKTIRRKVQEAIMALRIEHRFTKNEILTAYLNRVYFGDGAYGIDAAAKVYFNKSARDLTLWQSAVLAGPLKAPSRFSPATNPVLAAERARVVLETMQEAGYLDAKTVAAEKRNTVRVASSLSGDLNHYFADWVMGQIDSYVTDTNTDLVVRTTLDPALQLMAEAKQKALFKKIKPEDHVSQAALITESPDGAVLAMTGGVDYTASQFNRATQALRQPGSAFKPFVYLAAMEAGFSPDDKIEDSPLTTGAYRPSNYDNEYFGTVTLTQALMHSLNTATIRLLEKVGIERVLDVAARAGITWPLQPDFSTALGTGAVTLLELTSAYAVIQNGGHAVWPFAVRSIEDQAGHVIYLREPPQSSQVFSPQNIAELDSMLVQVVAQGTGKAAQLSRGHVAGKTGTTQNYHDALFMGYTDNLITGVWMGNDDNAPMHDVTGGKYPAQLWHNYMEEAISFKIPVYKPPAENDDPFMHLLNSWAPPSGTPAYNR